MISCLSFWQLFVNLVAFPHSLKIVIICSLLYSFFLFSHFWLILSCFFLSSNDLYVLCLFSMVLCYQPPWTHPTPITSSFSKISYIKPPILWLTFIFKHFFYRIWSQLLFHPYGMSGILTISLATVHHSPIFSSLIACLYYMSYLNFSLA